MSAPVSVSQPSPPSVRQHLPRALLLALMLASLLVPGNRLSPWVYPLVFGVPLAVTAFRPGADDAFRLWALYVASFNLFVVLRRSADELFTARWEYVVDLEGMLFGGVLPTHALQAALYAPQHPGPLDYLAIGIHLSYYAVPPLVAVLLWWRGVAFARYMVAISLLYLASLVVHALLPTTPPWLAGIQGHIGPVRRIVADVYYGVSPRFYTYGQYVAGQNDVAAMPSLHTAATWLAWLALRRVHPAAGWAGGAYALGMVVSLVYLGEHYVVDAIAGAALATACWWTVGACLARRGAFQP